MTDPRLISIVAIIFALIGIFCLYSGSRRMREARLAGHPVRWFRQINLLSGIEYLLLSSVFLLSLVTRQGNIAPGIRGLVVPLYFLLLIFAAIVAGLIIRRGILNSRELRAAMKSKAATPEPAPVVVSSERVPSKREQEEQAQRQRERRKKAAAARRRRAGKA